MYRAREFGIVFGLGAVGYCLIEILWRGYTHWSMALTGGYCMFMIYWSNTLFYSQPWWKKATLGALIITMTEFSVGCVVNITLGLGVWDYSRQPFHLWGQICPLYTLLWFLLSIPLYWLCSLLEPILSHSVDNTTG